MKFQSLFSLFLITNSTPIRNSELENLLLSKLTNQNQENLNFKCRGELGDFEIFTKSENLKQILPKIVPILTNDEKSNKIECFFKSDWKPTGVIPEF